MSWIGSAFQQLPSQRTVVMFPATTRDEIQVPILMFIMFLSLLRPVAADTVNNCNAIWRTECTSWCWMKTRCTTEVFFKLGSSKLPVLQAVGLALNPTKAMMSKKTSSECHVGVPTTARVAEGGASCWHPYKRKTLWHWNFGIHMLKLHCKWTEIDVELVELADCIIRASAFESA